MHEHIFPFFIRQATSLVDKQPSYMNFDYKVCNIIFHEVLKVYDRDSECCKLPTLCYFAIVSHIKVSF